MSRAGVGMVVEKLLTDESLRIRFARERMETIAELYMRGFELCRLRRGRPLVPDGCSFVVHGRRRGRRTAALRTGGTGCRDVDSH